MKSRNANIMKQPCLIENQEGPINSLDSQE